MNIGNHIIILVAAWLAVAGSGFFFTFVSQPRELERVEKAEKLASLKQAEVSALLSEVASTRQIADDAVRKWHARYKIIPDDLSSPSIVGYLNGLTTAGFKNFDVSLKGVQEQPDFSYYTFDVRGRGYYSSLYRFIWEVENNRLFYKIRNLKVDHVNVKDKEPASGNDRMQVMVSFSFSLEAFFGGSDGLSAPEAMYAGLFEGDRLPVARADERPPVPSEYLPSSQPRINPFFPNVLDELPPNTYDRMELESATLTAIVGNHAIFKEGSRTHRLGAGDQIYLGRVKTVDPKRDIVVIRMNKGGIVDEVELGLHAGEHFRQAMGSVRLTPITD